MGKNLSGKLSRCEIVEWDFVRWDIVEWEIVSVRMCRVGKCRRTDVPRQQFYILPEPVLASFQKYVFCSFKVQHTRINLLKAHEEVN